jgi:hypothetical protein
MTEPSTMDIDTIASNVRCENIQITIAWIPEIQMFNLSAHREKRSVGARSKDLGKALRKLFKRVGVESDYNKV